AAGGAGHYRRGGIGGRSWPRRPIVPGLHGRPGGPGVDRPGEEAARDRWDLRVFGYNGGWMHFDHLAQVWLRQAAKAWAWERLAGTEHPARLDQIIHDLGPLSQSRRRHRPDRGAEPA